MGALMLLFVLGFAFGVGVTLMGLLILASLVTAGAVDAGPEPEPRICDLASLDP